MGTENFTIAQAGSNSLIGGWSDFSTSMPFTNTSGINQHLGLRFNANALVTEFEPFDTLTLTLDVQSVVTSGDIQVTLVEEYAPAAWNYPLDGSLFPGTRTNEVNCTSPNADGLRRYTLSSTGLNPIVLDAGLVGPWLRNLRASQVALGVIIAPGESVNSIVAGVGHATLAAPDLSAVTIAAFTGIQGVPPGRVRAVRDARFGMPAFSSELVEDQEVPGLWVRQHDQDPEERDAEYEPSPSEGVVDDEIPNL